MGERRLTVVDPGHFHAALVQKEMYPQLSPQVQVYAPVGPDLADYVSRVAHFNTRAERPTQWQLEIHAGPDFLDRLCREQPASIAIFSGRNHSKVQQISAAVEAGMHVLADKPLIIRREDLPALEALLATADRRGLVVHDMMSGRHGVVAQLIGHLCDDPEVFGETLAGTRAEPAVTMASVHHLMKTVAGMPNPRPAWYFDVTQQGEGLADVGTHLVDRAHETLFPEQAIDWRGDIQIHSAARWPTPVGWAQFRQLTGEERWPDYLAPWVDGDTLAYFCNGRAQLEVRGVHVRLEVRWDWEAAAGDDTLTASYRGSRARIDLRQDAADGYRPEIYVVPAAGIAHALERRIAALQSAYPGLGLRQRGKEWRLAIPDALRIGHDAQFAALTRHFLDAVECAHPLSPRERANMLAKYYVCTEAVALAQR